MNKSILLVLSLLAFLAVSCKTTTTTGKHEMMDMHASAEMVSMMHMPMMEQPFQKTSNPDMDYIVNMIPHHQGAIDSSKAYLMMGTDPDVKMLATQIIADQEKEIADFNMLLPQLEEMNTDYSHIDHMKFGKESEMVMHAMMNSMMDAKLMDNPDMDFLLGMIPHHQGAIDASEKILEITKNEKIKEIAMNIIAAQEKEIADMTMYMENLK